MLEVCTPAHNFRVPNFFLENPEIFRPGIQDQPLPVLSNSRPFKTGHFPSHLSPKNETGIPEFEILYFNSRNSLSSLYRSLIAKELKIMYFYSRNSLSSLYWA